MNFCPNCGTVAVPDAKYCANCGSSLTFETDPKSTDAKDGKILIRAADRRCRVGAFADVLKTGDESALQSAQTDAWLDPESEEAEHAGEAFSSSRRPGPSDWVPTDCAWAVHVPPEGPASAPGGSLAHKFEAVGTVSGHTFADLRNWLGAPHMEVAHGAGRMRTWTSGGFFSTMSVAVVFDRYDVCIGIGSQVSF